MGLTSDTSEKCTIQFQVVVFLLIYLCAVSKEKSGDDVKMTRRDKEPRSNSPTRLGAISSAGVFKYFQQVYLNK